MIAFRSVTKRFASHLALDDLTVAVERGEVVALLGPNGCGKTTTLKLAAGLLKPDEGSVTVGDPPRPAWLPAARAELSFLPQRVTFPEALTGREIVEFYRQLRGAAAGSGAEVLQFASLNGAGERPVATYSGGMTQRLGLAVAMLGNAGALLLDEPTAALDPDGLVAFDELIRRRRIEGRTVLFSSHQVGSVERLADRCLVLVQGRLVAELSQSALREALSARGFIRIQIDRCPPALLESLRGLEVTVAWANGELTVSGGPAARTAALEIARGCGVTIRGLIAQDGELEAFYRELVGATRQPGRTM